MSLSAAQKLALPGGWAAPGDRARCLPRCGSMPRMTIAPVSVSGMAQGSPFDQLKKVDEFGEWWSARDLRPLYGYTEWRNFVKIIDRAKLSCATSAHDVGSHFVDCNKVDKHRHKVPDVRLTRYSAYLVAMEGDPAKPEIARAKTYFVVQTRKAELVDAWDDDLKVMMKSLQQIQNLRREQERQRVVQDMHQQQITQHAAAMKQHGEEMQRIGSEARQAAEEIERVRSRVADVEAITPLTDTKTSYSGKEAAQLCGFGHIVFFRTLRDLGVIYADQQTGGHKIYQRYIDQGWGHARLTEWANGRGWTWSPYFTAKGITGVQRLIKESQLPSISA